MSLKDIEAFIKLIIKICEEKNLQCCVKESLKGGLLTGISAVLGALLFGSIGLAIGGALGGGAAAISAKGKFQPMAVVIKNLDPQQKKQLCREVKNALQDFRIENAVELAMLLASTPALKELIIKEVTNYLQSQMYQIK